MPRPKKPRIVSGYPVMGAFVPEGIPVSGEISVSVEGMEAIRLSDFEHLDQDSSAQLMGVSRQTYGRILFEARTAIAEALVTGKVLRVQGGMYAFRGRHGHRHGRQGGRWCREQG
jgi:predicted DNA-binding protein (UPF0251 family)